MEATPGTYQVNGAVIRKLRMKAGLSTAEMAKGAQISERYLNHLENGYRTRMRPGSYTRLRTALGLPADSTEILLPSEDPPEKR